MSLRGGLHNLFSLSYLEVRNLIIQLIKTLQNIVKLRLLNYIINLCYYTFEYTMYIDACLFETFFIRIIFSNHIACFLDKSVLAVSN